VLPIIKRIAVEARDMMMMMDGTKMMKSAMWMMVMLRLMLIRKTRSWSVHHRGRRPRFR